MGHFERLGSRLVYRSAGQMTWVESPHRDTIRVRATPLARMPEQAFALMETRPEPAVIEIGDESATLSSGNLTATVCQRDGSIRFTDRDGRLVLADRERPHRGTRAFRHLGGDVFQAEACFEAYEGERFWGLGQHRHGRLDQKGCVLDLEHYNTHISIPFMVSSRGYGFLWNNPGIGRVELGETATRWCADGTTHLDYVVIAPREGYAGILSHYADLTGHSPRMPDWATGFWQCKLRYQTQDELMEVAHEYKRRGLPLSVIVVDYFHWTMMGEWKFDRRQWPDPEGMVRELRAMGIELMVSVWPTVNPDSEHYGELVDQGLLIGNESGPNVQRWFVDTPHDGRVYMPFYDATNPQARRFLWSKLRAHYYSLGIRLFWLDCNEPEIDPIHFENLRFHAGNGQQVAGLYPREHCRAIYEGLAAEGERDIISLARSTWAGGQRYGSVIWSGDIPSTFASLREQIRAGLNMSLSGIPWWTTDIGGFHGGDVGSPAFRELIVRWFEYGVFCPVFRLHGVRKPETLKSGGPNELWSFGEEAYPILREQLLLRERLRPYIAEQMARASETGLPPMRPLFVDFPGDAKCLDIDDQFMFGPDILVCPVAEQGQRRRGVYLPAGCDWTDFHTRQKHSGGQTLVGEAPLERIPIYLRAGRSL